MKDEYDFSQAEQGRFHVPAEDIDLPIYLEPQIARSLRASAAASGQDLQTLVNDLLRKDIEIANRFHRDRADTP